MVPYDASVSAANMTPPAYFRPNTDVPVTMGCVVCCRCDVADDDEEAVEDSIVSKDTRQTTRTTKQEQLQYRELSKE
jgi:hypothetical protein